MRYEVQADYRREQDSSWGTITVGFESDANPVDGFTPIIDRLKETFPDCHTFYIRDEVCREAETHDLVFASLTTQDGYVRMMTWTNRELTIEDDLYYN